VAERGSRILIVDDHASMRTALRAILETAGLEVVGEAADGVEALDLVDELRPDAVTMDLEMPRLDGVGAIRALAAPPDAPPVVVVSGSSSRDKVADALDAGAAAYVEKARAEEALVPTLLALLAPVSA
jgi:DNA-binding NarL/FixJ family response regulator